MSVLIKNMRMPKSCYDCPLYDDEDGFCEAQKEFLHLIISNRDKDTNCPLVEIKTPHGKLVEFIDVTTTFDEDSGTEQVNLGDAFSAYFKMRESNAVIEAEGETD